MVDVHVLRDIAYQLGHNLAVSSRIPNSQFGGAPPIFSHKTDVASLSKQEDKDTPPEKNGDKVYHKTYAIVNSIFIP